MRIGGRGLAIGTGAALGAAALLLAAGALGGPATPSDAPNKIPPPAVVDPGPWQDITWERIDAPALGGPLIQSGGSIVRAGVGFVVVGQDADGVEGRQDQVGAIWTSGDARTWVKRRIVAGVPAGDTAEVRLAAAGAAGILVVGGVCCSIESPAMWLVTDGGIERLVLPAGMRTTTFLDLESGPGGFVGGGVRSDGDPVDPQYTGALWHSPDGRTWTEVDPRAADLGPGDVRDVAWTGAAWIAVGSRDEGRRSDGAVWRSGDGVVWERLAVDDPAIAGPEEEALHRVLPLGGGLFAQGGSGTHADRLACEDAMGEGTVGIPGAVLSLSCSWLVTSHWTSADGTTWLRMPPVEAPFDGPPLPAPPDGRRLISHRVMDVGGPGLVVVDAETPRRVDGSDSVGTWISDDGATWRPVGGADQFPKDEFLQDLVVDDRTIVGIGDDGWDQPNGTDVVVWIGSFSP